MLLPGDTVNGPKFPIERSTLALAGSWTTNCALANPTPLASIVSTVQVPTCAKSPFVGIEYESLAVFVKPLLN